MEEFEMNWTEVILIFPIFLKKIVEKKLYFLTSYLTSSFISFAVAFSSACIPTYLKTKLPLWQPHFLKYTLQK